MCCITLSFECETVVLPLPRITDYLDLDLDRFRDLGLESGKSSLLG